MRGSGSGGERAIHMVSAFATQAGLVLGQEKVHGKSNEITVIPILLWPRRPADRTTVCARLRDRQQDNYIAAVAQRLKSTDLILEGLCIPNSVNLVVSR